MDKIKIPFTRMPTNIEQLLTKEDYMRALLHPAGIQRGIFEQIHFNKKYPQWHNIIILPDAIDDVIIYNENNCWEKVKFEGNIWKQFNDEYVNCFLYVYTNRNKMFPNSGISSEPIPLKTI
jgi:hypothetical protein